ncbi:hypothetical protein HanXRQr2_Chr04g0147181 [Helianthus annuus]|uniref:Uncharacterized protein n=1 Tax=Helianthus annuus TaxID=4232 RepID=A0A9K3NQW2_HELAN|nr:hypothetical protein HanXRQr2_Chr04g0147181 [Helianthus annuus]
MPCEATTGDFLLAVREIEKALQVAVESHAITLGQVWVTYENSHRKKRRALLGKLRSYCVATFCSSFGKGGARSSCEDT